MPLDYPLNLLRKVLILRSGPFRHILQLLLLIQGQFQNPTIRVHTLQNLAVLQTCLEKSRIQREAHALFYPFVFDEWVDAALLQVDQTAFLAVLADAGGGVQRLVFIFVSFVGQLDLETLLAALALLLDLDLVILIKTGRHCQVRFVQIMELVPFANCNA